ncbi:MAG: FAD-binding protein [Spirochaetales bacterium]|nr:FAD-binding protein [Spirochaetales bacterium]
MDEIKELVNNSKRCMRTGLCKIDFLNIGTCPSGQKHHYISYYPQGRLVIFRALVDKKLPLTRRLIEIADTCTLCYICDKQCYYAIELRVNNIIKKTKELINEMVSRESITEIEEDEFLKEIRQIVGTEWAENDPAILASYAAAFNSIGGGASLYIERLPKYIILPNSTQEVSDIIKVLNKFHIEYRVRGSGYSQIMTEGALIDFVRMKDITYDPLSSSAIVGPGVQAFSLYMYAKKYHLRPNFGQPASCMIANQIGSGMITIFQTRYNMMGDNYINAEIVDKNGEILSVNKVKDYNYSYFKRPDVVGTTVIPFICTRIQFKLYERPDNDKSGLIGFSNLKDALIMARDIAKKNMAEVATVFGVPPVCDTLHITEKSAQLMRKISREYLDFEYAILVIGNTYELEAIKELAADDFIDEDLFGVYTVGVKKLLEPDGLKILEKIKAQPGSFSEKFRLMGEYLIRELNNPPCELITEYVDDDLKEFFRKYYENSNVFKSRYTLETMLSSIRTTKRGHFIGTGFRAPSQSFIDNIHVVQDFTMNLAMEFDLPFEFVFSTPYENGKFMQVEWDIYVKPYDPKIVRRAKKAQHEIFRRRNALIKDLPGFHFTDTDSWIGLARKEAIIYENKDSIF